MIKQEYQKSCLENISPSFTKGKPREKKWKCISVQSGDAMQASIYFTKYKSGCSRVFYKIFVLENLEKAQEHTRSGVLC